MRFEIILIWARADIEWVLDMADFQFQPEADDSMTKLRMALEHMDGSQLLKSVDRCSRFVVESICKYTIPPEKYDFTIPVEPQQQSRMDIDIDPALLPEGSSSQTSDQPTVKSNLRLFPPPIFSRQHIPQLYKCVFLLYFEHQELTRMA